MPFGLTLYVDGVMDCRVSACCEYRHSTGKLLGSKTAHFGLVKVEGGKPCYRCQAAEMKVKENEEEEEASRVRRSQKITGSERSFIHQSANEEEAAESREGEVGQATTTEEAQQQVDAKNCML